MKILKEEIEELKRAKVLIHVLLFVVSEWKRVYLPYSYLVILCNDLKQKCLLCCFVVDEITVTYVHQILCQVT